MKMQMFCKVCSAFTALHTSVNEHQNSTDCTRDGLVARKHPQWAHLKFSTLLQCGPQVVRLSRTFKY